MFSNSQTLRSASAILVLATFTCLSGYALGQRDTASIQGWKKEVGWGWIWGVDDERGALSAAGAVPLVLGGRILRAETAVLAGLVLVQHRLGDLSAVTDEG